MTHTVQPNVLRIIEQSREVLGHPYITVEQIRDELKETPEFEQMDREHVKNEKGEEKRETKLVSAVSQALTRLKKKKEIKLWKGQGGCYTIVKKKQKYPPKVCKAITNEYELECSKCGKTEYVKSDTKPRKVKCKECGKRVSVRPFRYYCPVRKCYIGDPTIQCERIYYTTEDLEQAWRKKKFCYCTKKLNKSEIEVERKLYLAKMKREEQELELYEQKYHILDLVARQRGEL